MLRTDFTPEDFKEARDTAALYIYNHADIKVRKLANAFQLLACNIATLQELVPDYIEEAQKRFALRVKHGEFKTPTDKH